MPSVYILQCRDGSYYVGSTWDLERRLRQHNSPDQGALFTRRRRPVRVVWSLHGESIADCYAMEKQIQGWSRAKREALIRGEPQLLRSLARRRGGRPRGGR